MRNPKTARRNRKEAALFKTHRTLCEKYNAFKNESTTRLLQRERQRQRNDDDNTNNVFAFFEGDVVKKEFVVVFVF